MELMEFQKAALRAVEGQNKCAFYHDMGLGKTYTGGAKLMSFKNNLRLVVCQKSKLSDWIEHFTTNYTVPVYNLTKAKQCEALYQACARGEETVGVINYDRIFRPPFKDYISHLHRFAVLFDESSLLKNDQSKRTKAALAFNAMQVVLLSGTPCGGKYEELWAQCRLLGWPISKDDFWDRFICYKLWQPAPYARQIKLVTGYKNVDVLKINLRHYGAHFLSTNEVLELPEQMWQIVTVPQSKAYKAFMADNFVELNGVEFVGDMPLKKMLYARQLCGAFNADKLSAFSDWLDSTNERLIVFYNFDVELEALKRVTVRPISVVNGKVKDLGAYEQHSDSVTFIQYQAGAMGLNLQLARRIGYFTLPLSSELFEQSKKRIHRIGQRQTCFYYTFICAGSIEEQILHTLEQRNDYTLELFHGLH